MAKDYNQIDHEGSCEALHENTEAIAELTKLHNSGQNSELRAMVRGMIDTRLKESEAMQKWMNKRGIKPPAEEEEDEGGGGPMMGH